MTISLILIVAVAFAGVFATYLLSDKETLLWRLAAGCVIGSAIYGTAGFVIGSVVGLSSATALIALLVTWSTAFLLLDKSRRHEFGHDWAKAKGKLQGATGRKALRFLYYAGFALLFFAFFDRAMIVNDQGIFTGGSNNLGDLPFHLGAIFSFTEGNNLPPLNPNFSGTKFSYPFIADLLTAMFMKFGAGVREAMLVQNVAWAFSLLVILESFTVKLIGDRIAGRLAPALLFLSGGLGFVWFVSDINAQGQGIVEFLWHLPRDYTIGNDFRWGNSLVTLFLTQRSLLLGLPLTLVVLGLLWNVFAGSPENDDASQPGNSTIKKYLSMVVAGLIAGMLPLIHVHSLAVLFLFGIFVLVVAPMRWRGWIAFAAGAAVVAIPELLWTTTGSATRVSEFFGWHFGWDKRDDNFIWFWLKNTGLAIPLLAGGTYLIWQLVRHPKHAAAESKTKRGKHHRKTQEPAGVPHPYCLLLFYIPFALLFVVSNVLKLAPWEWDNVKLLVYWFVGSLPFICYAIAWLWRQGTWPRVAAVTLAASMTLSGGLDVWRTVSRQINYKVFDSDAVTVANRIRAVVRPADLFVNAPTYNSAVVLSGRPSFMRYSGHLSSHGIDYRLREEIVKSLYHGDPRADELIRQNKIDYVLVSPEERNSLQPNESYFSKYPVAIESGAYKVYKVSAEVPQLPAGH